MKFGEITTILAYYVARVCQRQLGFLVLINIQESALFSVAIISFRHSPCSRSC